MAVVKIPDENRTITDFQEAKDFLKSINIDFEIWRAGKPLDDNATDAEILDAYSAEIENLMQEGGYATADIINVTPETPNLEAMLNRFNKEHAHPEDEVRFCIEGSGVFHIHPAEGPIVAIEVGPGDLIRVPEGTHHWFDLCETHTIKCIRLFQDTAGWTPLYTNTGAEEGYIPVCMGPAFIAAKNLQSV